MAIDLLNSGWMSNYVDHPQCFSTFCLSCQSPFFPLLLKDPRSWRKIWYVCCPVFYLRRVPHSRCSRCPHRSPGHLWKPESSFQNYTVQNPTHISREMAKCLLPFCRLYCGKRLLSLCLSFCLSLCLSLCLTTHCANTTRSLRRSYLYGIPLASPFLSPAVITLTSVFPFTNSFQTSDNVCVTKSHVSQDFSCVREIFCFLHHFVSSHFVQTIFVHPHYRWVPLTPNMDHPNSTLIQSPTEITCRSLKMLICPLNLI